MTLPAERRLFIPRGAALELMTCREEEVLIEGPAGTGKTRACLEKAFLVGCNYPHSRQLFMRRTRESLTQSVLKTWEDKVLPEGSPILRGVDRKSVSEYRFPNGSEIVVGGLKHSGKDAASRIMSTEYDVMWCFEARELPLDSFEDMSSRLRNGVVPYQQIVADTNPDAPSHWLNRRAGDGEMKRLLSRHKDNPFFWSTELGDWTEMGRKYVLRRLEKLTGARRSRLLLGVWAAPEGMVYDLWSPDVHMVDRDTLKDRLFHYYLAGVDWGYSNAGVISVWGIDGDKRMYRVAEIYRAGEDIPWWVKVAKRLANHYDIQLFLCDPSRPDAISSFNRAKLPATGGENSIEDGISAVNDRLIVRGDGLPRILFVRDSLIGGPDPELDADKLPLCTEEEFENYVWPEGRDEKHDDEKPVDDFNHGMDAMRYVAMYLVKFGGNEGYGVVDTTPKGEVYRTVEADGSPLGVEIDPEQHPMRDQWDDVSLIHGYAERMESV